MKNQPLSRFDQDAWRFGVQVFFSSIVLALCIFKLALPGEDRNIALYWGGLSSVLAYWLPAPGQVKNEKDRASITQRTFASTNDGEGQAVAQISETKIDP